MTAVQIVALAACTSDAIVDLTIETSDGSPVATVDIVVCSARDRTEVLEDLTLDAGSSRAVHLPADGAAVALAATAPGDLCAATCQLVLGPDAEITSTLVLHPCLSCPTQAATASSVCQDPLCFLASSDLSACAD